jgi:hypothetical protein
MKHPEWRQPTPQMQLHAIVFGLEGQVTLIERGWGVEGRKEVLREYADQFMQLLPYIDGKEQW